MTAPWASGEVLTAADLNGITNWIWIPASSFALTLGSPNYGADGGWSNTAVSWEFGASATEAVLTSFYVPQTGNLNFDSYFQGGGSGNFRLAIDSAGGRTPGTPGDSMFTLTGYNHAVTIASYNGLAKWTLTSNMAVDAGDLVNIAFIRLGADAADTSANNCYFFGIKAYYV